MKIGKDKAESKKKDEDQDQAKSKDEKKKVTASEAVAKQEEPRRKIKAKSKSAFQPTSEKEEETPTPSAEEKLPLKEEPSLSQPVAEPEEDKTLKPKAEEPLPEKVEEATKPAPQAKTGPKKMEVLPTDKKVEPPSPATAKKTEPLKKGPAKPINSKLGPTGKHIDDLLPPKKAEKTEKKAPETTKTPATATPQKTLKQAPAAEEKAKPKKPTRKPKEERQFHSRSALDSAESGEPPKWRKKRYIKKPSKPKEEIIPDRPEALNIRLPISLKDLAAALKVKASDIISKLFLQGTILTLNDTLDDETMVQLIGEEFNCTITIDTSEEERIRITDKTIKEEISEVSADQLISRPPVVTFMGHVDHGKTSIIDWIRKSKVAAGEKGAITQHIGAFRCTTSVGDITILDTPGHEAFSEMRARGADVTDIVVLVIAGDEGIKAQTVEAIQHAKAAGVSIVVAINKCDKPNFNADNAYRQLADNNLLPEPWGGSTITVNCSAITGEGITDLLEMLALQSEMLELNANPSTRARGTVIESEMHKGLGATTTLLVQNGTLHKDDSLVFDLQWGHVKTMRNEFGEELLEAGPSSALEITGLSGLPDPGSEFVAVSDDREARNIAERRVQDHRDTLIMKQKKTSLENLFQQASESEKKFINVVLRADTHGSLEALKSALLKIESDKVDLNIIFAGIGEISESDVQLAAASNAIVMGFHTKIESHADQLVKDYGVVVSLHDIIYHAVDKAKDLMTGALDKIAQERDTGTAEVRLTFKASQLGVIAGCQVMDGLIKRNNYIRVVRDGDVIWQGKIASIKREKNDVREIAKGFECGILLDGFNDVKEGDKLEAYEVIYIEQEL
ncbi:MAG: translation initiation factor IF-2 [Chlamydiota bacterium]